MDKLLPTEYVEDGYVYEVIYHNSEVLTRLEEMMKEGREGWIKRNWIISDMTEIAKDAVKKSRKAAPLGLADVSILTRLNGKQRAYGYAVSDYCKSNFPKLFKRLFTLDDPLYNACMAMAVCAFDEMYRWTGGDKSVKPIMLSGAEIDEVISRKSIKKGLDL